MLAVFDTNVFVSALVTRGGKGEQAFRLILEGAVELVVSVPILTETANVLAVKFLWEREEVDRAVRLIASVGRVVRPAKKVAVCGHEPDNRVLECALDAEADLVVTGDRHLPALGRFEGARIVTLAQFPSDAR